jgi:hypothetical protein
VSVGTAAPKRAPIPRTEDRNHLVLSTDIGHIIRTSPEQARAAVVTVCERAPKTEVVDVLKALGLVYDPLTNHKTEQDGRPNRHGKLKEAGGPGPNPDGTVLTDAGDTQRALQDWKAAGLSLKNLANLGCGWFSYNTLCEINNGRKKMVVPELADHIRRVINQYIDEDQPPPAVM